PCARSSSCTASGLSAWPSWCRALSRRGCQPLSRPQPHTVISLPQSLLCWHWPGCAAGGASSWSGYFYQGNSVGFVPGQLGAAYFIPTVVVPLLLITHGLVFRLLLQRE